jgi:hypothetical protein
MTTSGAPALAGIRHLKLPVTDLARSQLDDLARRLTAQGEAHAGVRWASIGWILPALHDPDGQEIRFCTIEQNAGPGPQLAAI